MNEKLAKAREEYQRKVAAGEITRTLPKSPIEKWKENKKSLRLSINAFCWECIGENVKDIRYCTATNCPLYEVRPYQEKKDK